MAGHRNGISLIYARTETRMWQELVFPHARLLLFIRGRIWFYTPDGKRAVHGCPAPSVLIAYDEANANALRASGIKGALVEPCRERGAA
jgi:hypothetical protein